MKIIRFVLYLALGFICSSLLLFLTGDGGVLEYKVLIEYWDVLEENIQQLKTFNQGLLEELESLSSDPDSIALQARELGYFKEDERIIRLDGYRPAKNYYTVGKIIKKSPGTKRQDWILKLFGLIIPVVLYIFHYLKRKKSNYGDRN